REYLGRAVAQAPSGAHAHDAGAPRPAVHSARHRQHQPPHARGLHSEAAQVLPAPGPALPLTRERWPEPETDPMTFITFLPALILAAQTAAAPAAAASPPTTAAPSRLVARIPLRLSVRPRLTVGDRFEVTLVVKSAKQSLVTGPLAEST